jgi:hypothetical protein
LKRNSDDFYSLPKVDLSFIEMKKVKKLKRKNLEN